MTKPLIMLTETTMASAAGIYVAVDRCALHHFTSLSVYTLDEGGVGGGTRLLGPKSCCTRYQEVARWRVTADDLDGMSRELGRYAFEEYATEFHRDTGITAPGKDVSPAMGETHSDDERLTAWQKWRSARRAPRSA